MAFRNTFTRLSQFIADSIVGAFIATADPPLQRWEMDSIDANEIRGYSGQDDETQPAIIFTDKTAATRAKLRLTSPELLVGAGPAVTGIASLILEAIGIAGRTTKATLDAEEVELAATDGLILLTATSGVQINSAINPIREIDFGTFSGNTDAASNFTANHNLGATPVAVFAILETGTLDRLSQITNLGAATFRMQFRDGATNAGVGAGVAHAGWYLAIR